MDITARIVARWASSVLVETGEKTWNGLIYSMPLARETFIHFTVADRVETILASGKLLFNPPFKKSGVDSVFAISRTYGVLQPTVQTTHFKNVALMAIQFKTHTLPKYGYVEEVLWDEDVTLLQPEVLEPGRAAALLRRPPVRLRDGDMVTYT